MITATQIADWAKTNQAQRDLPRLIRRLVHSVASSTNVAMPSGDSTSLPGFDGELFSEAGSTWVPQGHSCWELSCRQDVGVKANEDYNKRTDAAQSDQIAKQTYVAVTARRWPSKSKWVSEKNAGGAWHEVRAIDADDIEQWLEQAPAVALAFAEELGLAGVGVVSLSTYFSSWSAQSKPRINTIALLTGRDAQRDRILYKCRGSGSNELSAPVPIKGDSVEEAVAFTAATLLQDEGIALRTVVVTDNNGWQFVAKNPNIRIAIAARPEIAEAPPQRDGLLVVVPYAKGDMSRQFKGTAGRLDDDETILDRVDHYEFDRALQELGIEENDARRLSGLCGRSWSIFRRQHATNPAIRSPAWLEHSCASALSLVCLVGSWSSSKEADKEALSQIAGRSYESLERDLLTLEKLDDSPVIHIGTVWKAKSPLELLALFADRISEAEIERFFTQAEEILGKIDPIAELPKDARELASFKGIDSPTSAFLEEAVCDTLVKLSVRGPDFEGLAAKHIDTRVAQLVRRLLENADKVRWLSLSERLPALAEAAPSEFMTAVEAGLERADSPVRALLEETDGAGILNIRCWHAGLLWALEKLAWAPQRLTRVSLILARLSETEIKGNWANTPANSLLDLYRSWLPQTAANIEQRIAALDILIKGHPAAAMRLLDGLTQTGHDMASPSARPDWRDDDSGAGYGASGEERHQMLVAAADRQLSLASGDPVQLAALVEKYHAFDDARRATVIALLQDLQSAADDEDKEVVRTAIRRRLHWHRNYDQSDDIETTLAPLQGAYDHLAPKDVVIRDAWLFRDGWVDLPQRTRDDDFSEREKQAARMRSESLSELFEQEGWHGLLRLASYSGGGWLVGRTILSAKISIEAAIIWLAQDSGSLKEIDDRYKVASGLLSMVVASSGFEILDEVLRCADEADRDTHWKVRLLALLPEQRQVWTIVDTLGTEAVAYYWEICPANYLVREEETDRQFALEQLIEARRPLTAFRSCHADFDGIAAETVTQMLEGILRGDEEITSLPEYWYFQKAIDHIEDSESIDRTRLIHLEFALVRALGFEGEQHARTLYREVMSNPSAFVELLSMVFFPKTGERVPGDEAHKSAAESAWSVLHACKRQPGTQEDDTVSTKQMDEFVRKARDLATEADRLEVCDSQLGQILAHAPLGDDGVFPFGPARDALEAIGTTDILNGFRVGCFNKRGVHTRGVFDGGDQERDLAAIYRSHAEALQVSHPRVSATLEALASSYDRDGVIQDLDAKLNRERR